MAIVLTLIEPSDTASVNVPELSNVFTSDDPARGAGRPLLALPAFAMPSLPQRENRNSLVAGALVD